MTMNSGILSDRSSGKKCPGCGTDFACGPQAGQADCWCNALPPLSPIDEGSDCLCPDCLRRRIAAQSRAAPALVEGEDYYHEGAAMVFTARYHLRRGYCCGNGCRHCPYKDR